MVIIKIKIIQFSIISSIFKNNHSDKIFPLKHLTEQKCSYLTSVAPELMIEKNTASFSVSVENLVGLAHDESSKFCRLAGCIVTHTEP